MVRDFHSTPSYGYEINFVQVMTSTDYKLYFGKIYLYSMQVYSLRFSGDLYCVLVIKLNTM